MAKKKRKESKSRIESLSTRRLEQTGGILAALDRPSPARTLLGGTGREHMALDPEAVLAPPGGAPTEADASALEPPPSDVREPAAGDVVSALIDDVAQHGLEARAAPEPLPVGEDDFSVELERAPRVPLETYVKVVKGERVARALTRDISESGIFLSAMALPVVQAGDAVLLELMLPGRDEPIWIQGRAVRDASGGGFHTLAIQFTHLTEVESAAIRAYVTARVRLLG